MLISFDIFDTLLIRKCGLPDNIFYLTAQRLFSKDRSRADNFYLWRCGAESRLSNPFATLEDIYGSFESDYFKISKELAISIEKVVEWDNLTVNPRMKQCVESWRRQGEKICYISDTYLDQTFLRGVLEREEIITEDEKLYISSQHNASKADGKLYDIVRRDLSPKKWRHYGDNPHSDIKMARRKGIKAAFVDSSFTEGERYLIDHFASSRDRCLYSSIVGAMRSVRLSLGGCSAAEIASGYIAPLYISYVNYTLKSATKEGIKRLYFLNRDSFILYEIAKQLNTNNNLKLKYLFVSRRSLILPAIDNIQTDEILKLFEGGTLIGKSVDSTLDMLKLNREILTQHGVKIPFNIIRTTAQQKLFLLSLFKSRMTPEFKERVSQQKSLLLKYLNQEGVTTPIKSAFIDVGWLGTSRLMVNRVLSQAGFSPVVFYYLGVRKDILDHKYGQYHSFINRPVNGVTALIENYFSASPFHSVLSYKTNNKGVVEPVFKGEQSYTHNSITEYNLQASISLIETLNGFGVKHQLPLEQIALESLRLLKNQRVRINYDATLHIEQFDTPLSDKTHHFTDILNPIELCRYTLLGEQITSCDDISVSLTINSKTAQNFMRRIHSITSRARGWIYRSYTKRDAKR